MKYNSSAACVLRKRIRDMFLNSEQLLGCARAQRGVVPTVWRKKMKTRPQGEIAWEKLNEHNSK